MVRWRTRLSTCSSLAALRACSFALRYEFNEATASPPPPPCAALSARALFSRGVARHPCFYEASGDCSSRLERVFLFGMGSIFFLPTVFSTMHAPCSGSRPVSPRG